MNQRHKLCSLHFILVPFGPDLCCSMLLPSSPFLQICDTKLVSPMASAHLHTKSHKHKQYAPVQASVSERLCLHRPFHGRTLAPHAMAQMQRLFAIRDIYIIYGCCKTKWGMKTEGKVHLSLHRLSCHQGAGFEWS